MKALIIVDVQNDFVPGGALPVPEGHLVVPIINRLQPHFDLVVATQDWHPANHGSFAANHSSKQPGDVVDLSGLQQILWPVHCVQNTPGAAFVPGLDTSRVAKVFQKGVDAGIDSYSGFFDNGHRKATGLGDYLRQRGVTEVYVAGLATDYCVKFTALDALQLGFKAFLITDASRGVNLQPGDVDRAVEEMQRAGVTVLSSATILDKRTSATSASQTILGQGHFLRLVKSGRWEYADRINCTGAVVITAITPDQKLLLAEQYRIPVGKPVIELPAGIVGDEPERAREELLEAARRELLEETGYEAETMEIIMTGPTSAGLSSEQVTMILATDLHRVGQGGGVPGEQITIHEIPFAEAAEWLLAQIKQGKLVDPKVFAGIYFAQQEIELR